MDCSIVSKYNFTTSYEDSIVLPSILFKYYPDFYIPNYTDADLNIIRKYLLFCSMLYHLGIIFNIPVIMMTYSKCILIYNIIYRYLYSIDSYTSVKNILTGMFLFDMFQICFYKSIYERKMLKTIDFVILYHHIVIIMAYIFEPQNDFTYVIVYGESTNILLNVEYCMIKYRPFFKYHPIFFRFNEEAIPTIMKRINELNIIIYVVIRVFFFTYFLMFLDYTYYSVYYATIPLYLMGIIWSKKLLKQWKKNHMPVSNIVD